MRPSHEQQRNALKNAFKHLVRLAGGGTFADMTRVNGPALSKYGSISEPDHHAPIDVVLDAELQAETPIITMLLADLQGFELVRRAPVKAARINVQDMHVVLSGAVRVADEIRKALDDGRVDAGERLAIANEIKRTIRDLQHIEKGL